jgi:membrane dipeptidase
MVSPPTPSRVDVEALSALAGVSREAVQLLASSEVVDLHLETFIPSRLWGYDLHRSHRGRAPWGRFFGHLDLPRVHAGGLTAAMWSLATNVARPRGQRAATLQENVRDLAATLERDPAVAIVRDARELQEARAASRHAALVSVQGGNAFEGGFADPSGLVTRVTLVHLSNSTLGHTSSPLSLGRRGGLTPAGRDMVAALDASRVFLDLAHASEQTFWDALDAHDRTLPAIVTHTCMRSVHDMWRNIDDRQARAVADTGGVVGVMFHGAFLGPGARDGRAVIRHLEAVVRAAGEDAAALGSDYDGFILPPPDLRDGEVAYARLVQYMLEARWPEARIRNVLGASFLRAFERLRPGTVTAAR